MKEKQIIRNYSNLEQYNQIDNCDAFNRNKKEKFSSNFITLKVIDLFLNHKSFVDNFYLFSLKQNSLKANRLYIYINDDKTLTVDFISQWKDKSKDVIVRNIKKTIENISIDSLIMVLQSI